MSNPARTTACVFESMEPRELLAADLAVISVDAVPTTVGPGGSVHVTWLVRNVGDTNIGGQWKDVVYLSADNKIDASDTVLYSQTVNVNLMSPNVGYVGNRNVTLPASVGEGPHYIIVQTDSEGQQGEASETNNVMATQIQVSLTERRFGVGNGENYGKAVLTDALGTKVTFVLTGGGWGEVVGAGADTRIVLHDTTTRSVLKVITTGKGSTTTVADIEVNGSINNVLAKTTNVTNSVIVSGSANKIQVGDVTGADVRVDQVGKGTILMMNNVQDAKVNFAGPIRTLMVNQWLDSDDEADIVSSWIGKAMSKGAFQGDANLSGLGATKTTLGNAMFGGPVDNSTWDVTGNGGKVTFKQDANAQLNFSGVLLGVMAKRMLSGQVNALGANTITAGDMQNLDINFSLSDPSRLAANKISSKMWMDNVHIRTGGSLGTVTTGGMKNSDVYLGFFGADPFGASSNDLNGAAVRSLMVRGIKGEAHTMMNSNIVATDLGTMTLKGVETDNGGVQFGLVGLGARKLTIYTDTGKMVWQGGGQVLPNEGDFTVVPVV